MSRTYIIALLIFGAILGIFSFGPTTTQKFKAGVYQLLAPFLTSGSGLKKQITSVRSGLKSLEQLEHENSALQVENRELRATSRACATWNTKSTVAARAQLSRALGVQTDRGGNYRARFLDLVAHSHHNRGRRDGVETDMPVVTDIGLVGKTTTVSDIISIVLLISDENCWIAASIEGSREQGIVSGERVTTGMTPLLDLNLPKQAD
jgi:rod shape-determining protein MreC